MAVTLTGSVGDWNAGAQNSPEDVSAVQRLLANAAKQLKDPTLDPGPDDGKIAKPPRVSNTVNAIRAFQKKVVKMANPDGRVDRGGETLRQLNQLAGSSGGETKQNTSLPTQRGGSVLTEADYTAAATSLKCEVACIKAVVKVESGSSGFLPSGRPKILFEAHVFSRETKGKYNTSHPDISSKVWNKALYKGGEKEFDRLEKAMALDRQAALRSASWGRFQIMGFNHAAAGHATLDGFITAMYTSEGEHLKAFIKFLQSQNLAAPLREKRWADFARGYNGSQYAANQYDVKLKTAYEQFSKAK